MNILIFNTIDINNGIFYIIFMFTNKYNINSLNSIKSILDETDYKDYYEITEEFNRITIFIKISSIPSLKFLIDEQYLPEDSKLFYINLYSNEAYIFWIKLKFNTSADIFQALVDTKYSNIILLNCYANDSTKITNKIISNRVNDIIKYTKIITEIKKSTQSLIDNYISEEEKIKTAQQNQKNFSKKIIDIIIKNKNMLEDFYD